MKAFDDAIQMGYSTLSRVRSMRVRQLCCRKRKHAPRRSKATTEPVEHLGRRRWLRREIFRGWDVIVPRRRLGFSIGCGKPCSAGALGDPILLDSRGKLAKYRWRSHRSSPRVQKVGAMCDTVHTSSRTSRIGLSECRC